MILTASDGSTHRVRVSPLGAVYTEPGTPRPGEVHYGRTNGPRYASVEARLGVAPDGALIGASVPLPASPRVVRNLQVRQEGVSGDPDFTNLVVTWEPPTETPLGYVVVVNGTQFDAVAATSYTVTGQVGTTVTGHATAAQYQDGNGPAVAWGDHTLVASPVPVTAEMMKVGNPQASYVLAADGLSYDYTLTWTQPAAAVESYLVLAGDAQITPSPAPTATSHTWTGGQPGASLTITFTATSAQNPDVKGVTTFPTLNFPALESPWKEPRNLISTVTGGDTTCTWDAPEVNAEGVPVRAWRFFLDGGYYDQKDAGSVDEANVFQYDPATEFYTVPGVTDPTRVAVAAGYQTSNGFVLSNRVTWPAA